jgi:hypothetical protein
MSGEIGDMIPFLVEFEVLSDLSIKALKISIDDHDVAEEIGDSRKK